MKKQLLRITRQRTGNITRNESHRLFSQIACGNDDITPELRKNIRTLQNWRFFISGITLSQKGRLTSNDVENLRRFFHEPKSHQ